MAAWLSEHPEVLFSDVKEPNFFNSDMKREWSHVGDLQSYDALFCDAGPEHKALGEATTLYLFSDVAVPNILEYSPDARFIVMMREPVGILRSLHDEFVHAGLQMADTLWDAIDAQKRRPTGTPKAGEVLDRKYVDYISCCSLGWQLERLFQRVPEDRVHLVRLEDMTADADQAFAEVCEFLGVSRISLPDHVVHNRGRKIRYPKLKKLMNMILRLKYRLKLKRSFLVGRLIQRFNAVEAPREEMSQEELDALGEHFRADTALLERITQRK